MSMITKSQKTTPCLWYDTQAEEAVHFYTSLFTNLWPWMVARISTSHPKRDAGAAADEKNRYREPETGA
jgi:predicted 3-demethylubiquinone-9 3-methyltransferase (glyoxalase superfamily)